MSSRSTFKYPFPVNNPVNKDRMMQLIEKYWRLNRTAVNPDTDKLIAFIADELKSKVIEAKSGEEVLTWQVPKHWCVNKAQIRKVDGTVIVDWKDNPLYLWTNSIPFNGKIGRDDFIENHLITDVNRPEEVLYHYRNGYCYNAEEWGFSLPYTIVEKMDDPEYVIEIDSVLDDNGTIKVADTFLTGRLKETIFIMAHTCHPGLVSDGLANIAVAIELFQYLKRLPDRKYSYRFIFGPEYFASAVYLSKADREDVENLTFGIYLDMLSNHEPIGFQYSMQGDSLMDRVFKNVLSSHASTYLEKPYRELWGNDEMFYNGLGFFIPTVGLGRGMHREYHYSSDNLENINIYHMVESVWFLMRITEVFETDYVPVPNYKGPLYLSRYGLYMDPTVDHDMARKIEKLQVIFDGKRSCMDIAEILDIDFFFVRDFMDKMEEKGLLSKSQRVHKKSDMGNIP